MSRRAKISPAFEPFLAESGPRDKREAIVVYDPQVPALPPLKGRLRTLKQRLDAIKERAQAHESTILGAYQEQGSRQAKDWLDVQPVGEGTLPVATVEVTRATLQILAAQPGVRAIMPNQQIHLVRPREVEFARLTRQERQQGCTWGLEQLGVPDLWPTTQGEDINVAVLDTGVHGDHPSLAGRVKQFVVVDPLGRRITTDQSFDAGRHGTHVCGTIAGGTTSDGVAIGVAPKANLLVAGVLIGDSTLQTLMEGLSWAIEQGADIVSMSLGFRYYEPLFAQIFDMLIAQYGILPVVAIGNENHGNTSSPGNAYSAFSVGAIEKMPRGSQVDVAFFSSGASLVFPGQEPNALVNKPDLVAPGAQIYSCIPPTKTPSGIYEYTYMNGTSMATPHVAGVAALLMAARPEASVQTIIEVLRATAVHPRGDTRRPDNRWGYGLIQPAAALAALG